MTMQLFRLCVAFVTGAAFVRGDWLVFSLGVFSVVLGLVAAANYARTETP